MADSLIRFLFDQAPVRGECVSLDNTWLEVLDRHDYPPVLQSILGELMAAAALLKAKPRPTDADIDEAMTNICRCGTYTRIREGIHLAAQRVAGGSK